MGISRYQRVRSCTGLLAAARSRPGINLVRTCNHKSLCVSTFVARCAESSSSRTASATSSKSSSSNIFLFVCSRADSSGVGRFLESAFFLQPRSISSETEAAAVSLLLLILASAAFALFPSSPAPVSSSRAAVRLKMSLRTPRSSLLDHAFRRAALENVNGGRLNAQSLLHCPIR